MLNYAANTMPSLLSPLGNSTVALHWRNEERRETRHTHFKCNVRLIAQYPNLLEHTREVYQLDGLGEATVNMKHIKHHYYKSHVTVNPHGLVPTGPDFLSTVRMPHSRGKL